MTPTWGGVGESDGWRGGHRRIRKLRVNHSRVFQNLLSVSTFCSNTHSQADSRVVSCGHKVVPSGTGKLGGGVVHGAGSWKHSFGWLEEGAAPNILTGTGKTCPTSPSSQQSATTSTSNELDERSAPIWSRPNWKTCSNRTYLPPYYYYSTLD